MMKKYLAVLIGLAAAVGILLAGVGVWLKSSLASVAIIGGADGPTSIFIAGRIDGTALLKAGAVLLSGALVIGLLLILILGRKRK